MRLEGRSAIASAKQLTANRRNAQRSTGPRTKTGKLKSSQNSLRHGLTGHVVLLSSEDPIQFEGLCEDLSQDLQPEGVVEQQLVDQIAICMWRLHRLYAIEAGVIDHEHFRAEQEDIIMCLGELSLCSPDVLEPQYDSTSSLSG